MWVHQVRGFRGAEHKSFGTREEAEEYMGNVAASTSGPAMPRPPIQSPVQLKVKRSRSLSPGPGQPSIKFEVCLDYGQDCQDMVLMSRVFSVLSISVLLV